MLQLGSLKLFIMDKYSDGDDDDEHEPVLQLALSLYFCDRQTITTTAFSTAVAIASSTEPPAHHYISH